MKKLTLLALLLSATVVYSQTVNNYMPNAGDRVPSGASGPGVVLTQRTIGKIIGVGAPIMQNFPIGQQCGNQGQRQPRQEQSSFNMGTVLGTIVGGVVGSRIGQGDGQLVATAVGGATGAVVGNNINRSMNASANNGQDCQTVFEQRIVGYSFVAQYDRLQMQGFMKGQPILGQDVEIIIHSTFYAGQ